MNIDEAFPSKWLKAGFDADIRPGQPVTVTISRVIKERVQDDENPVVYFSEFQKGLVLNKTNANRIKDQFGSETDNWPGKQIILHTENVEFQGKSGPAIRVMPQWQVQQMQQGQPVADPNTPNNGHPNAPGNQENNPPGNFPGDYRV